MNFNNNQTSNQNIQNEDKIENQSELDSEERRDREYMANWNFAEASNENSIIKPNDEQLPVSNQHQNDQNFENQQQVLKSKRQHQQKIFNDYLVQDLSKQSPRKVTNINEINPIILNSNTEENSRFTELSSIRETPGDQNKNFDQKIMYAQRQSQQQLVSPQGILYQYQQQEEYIPENILAVQNQIKQQISQNVEGFKSADGPQQKLNPSLINRENYAYDQQSVININPTADAFVSSPNDKFYNIQQFNEQPCMICINENKKRRKQLIKQNFPADQFKSIICNHQFQQPINKNFHDDQIQQNQKYQSNQSYDSEQSDENQSNSYQNESDDSYTSESDESCLTFHDDPSVQPDPNNPDQKGLSYFGKGQNIQNNYNQNNTYHTDDKIDGNINRESHLLPIYFAKEHIIKIEEDMKRMHERHVNLMREMDKNYKLIEEETQEYYIEFLKKWKEVAKQRIQSYRKTTETLTLEKEKIEKEKAIESENLNQQITKLLKEKQNLQIKLNEDIIARDNELELQKLEFEHKLKKKEQEIFNLQNQNKKLELQVIEISVEKKTNVDQLKSQLNLLNEQIEYLQQIEQNFKLNINDLQSQLEDNQQEKQNLQILLDQQKQDITELKKQVNSGLSQLKKQKEESLANISQIDKKSDEIQKLLKEINKLTIQVTNLKQINQNIQVQDQQANQDQGQISLSLKQNENSQSILSSFNQKKPSEKQIKFPNNEHSSNSQPPNPAISQQSQLLSQIKIKQVGGGSKNLILKPQSILQNQNQSFNSIVSSGSNSIGIGGILNSKINQNLLLLAPMSEQDYQNKLSKIQIEFNNKLDEIKNLIDFLNQKMQLHPNILQDNSSYSNSLSLQSDSQNKQIQFDILMKQKLEIEEKEQKKKMNDEIQKLKKTYEQSQKAQIHQKNNLQIQQNRNQSLQFLKRNENNLSNLSKIDSADVSINQNLVNNSLNKIQSNLKIHKKNILNKSIENPYSSNPSQSQLLNKESPFQTKASEESKSGSLQGSGQSGASNQLQLISQGALMKNILPQGSENNLSILKSAREPTNKLSLRDLNHDDNSYQNTDNVSQTQVLNELKLKIQNLSNENQELNFKIQGLEKDLTGKKDLEKELQDVRLSLITGISAIQSQRNTEEITKLNDLLKNHQETQKELEELKKELKAKKKEYASNLQYAKTKCDQLKSIAAKLNDDKTALKGKLKSLEAVNEKMKNQGDELIQQQRQETVSLKKQNDELRDQNDRLWLKYQTETIQRKRLHNQIEDMKGKIRVYCRVRPMNLNELRMGCIDAISLVDQFTLRIRVKKDQQLYKQSNQIQSQGQQQNQYAFKEFVFDSCFGQKTNQDEIFEDTKMLIQSAIDGFNVCIFAYGQTGSGKTYTVTGTEENQGIVPRGFQEMFSLKQKMEKDGLYIINFQCYMVELYLDKLIDLLVDGQKNQNQTSQTNQDKLEIREDPISGMVYIQNAKHKQLNTYQEALDTFNQGLKSRKVSSTEMNDLSSRSHLIFSVVIEAQNKKNGEVCKGKISFVDLAGSERSHKSNPSFNLERQKESNAINLSLKSLGDVIACLSNEEMSKAHIPYRNNKLTYLMKDSLGGNSKTLMFVNISPADYNAQESLNSLQFGHRVKMVQNEVSKNVESDALQKLRQENFQLKKKLGE